MPSYSENLETAKMIWTNVSRNQPTGLTDAPEFKLIRALENWCGDRVKKSLLHRLN
jgi:hypothetical protein